jgi:hypothetical protein
LPAGGNRLSGIAGILEQVETERLEIHHASRVIAFCTIEKRVDFAFDAALACDIANDPAAILTPGLCLAGWEVVIEEVLLLEQILSLLGAHALFPNLFV